MEIKRTKEQIELETTLFRIYKDIEESDITSEIITSVKEALELSKDIIPPTHIMENGEEIIDVDGKEWVRGLLQDEIKSLKNNGYSTSEFEKSQIYFYLNELTIVYED